MSSACIEKLFCGIYSAFKCSFDEFVGEKVVSLSCSSAILGLPLRFLKNRFVVEFLASLGLGCRVWGLSSCGERGPLFALVHGLPGARASCCSGSSCGAQALGRVGFSSGGVRGMWKLP